MNFYLRILLKDHQSCGKTSKQDMSIVDGVQYDIYQSICCKHSPYMMNLNRY